MEIKTIVAGHGVKGDEEDKEDKGDKDNSGRGWSLRR